MNLRLLVASSIIGLSLVACGGGGNPPAPLNTSTSSVASTLPASAANQQVTLPPSAFPAGSGFTGATYTLPFAISGNVSVATSTVVPGGVSAFAASGPVAQGERSGQATDASAKPLLFVALTAPSAIALTGNFAVSFGLVPTNGVDYHIAAYNGASWNYDVAGVGTVGSSTVSFNGTFPSAAALSQGTTYAIALYTVTTGDKISPASLSANGVLPVSTTGATFSGSILGGTATATVPAATVGGNVDYVVSTSAPTGISAYAPSSGKAPYAYVKMTPETPVSFAAGSTASGTFSASALTSGSYKVAAWTGTQWIAGVATATVNNSSASVTYQASSAISLKAGTAYALALYQ